MTCLEVSKALLCVKIALYPSAVAECWQARCGLWQGDTLTKGSSAFPGNLLRLGRGSMRNCQCYMCMRSKSFKSQILLTSIWIVCYLDSLSQISPLPLLGVTCGWQYFLWQDKTTPLEKTLCVKISAFLTSMILKTNKQKF